jgi:retron-type reverse transcriptase
VAVEELRDYLKAHLPHIREELLQEQYKSQPVKQVLIPKQGGGTRILRIPTVLDRLIQHALLQVLILSMIRRFRFTAMALGLPANREAAITSASTNHFAICPANKVPW